MKKQRIRTISAKALFEYFPKENKDGRYTIYLINKSLCRYVIKQEEDMEECPVFYQLYEVMKNRRDKNEVLEDSTMLLNELMVMDFEDVFTPYDSDNDNVKEYKEYIQLCSKDVIENGFDLYPETSDIPVHMVAFDKSGNMSRNSRISFVDEKYYDALNERLNLGIDFSKIEVQESKYYAYRGLYLSSSKRIDYDGFEITPEKLIVLKNNRMDPKDPNKPITGYNYESAKVISAKEYLENKEKVWKIEEGSETERLDVETPFDGTGFVTPSYSKLINLALGTEKATSFQIRLPFAKGMLHCVDVHGFLEEYDLKKEHIYVDAFGIERNLDKAEIFITESMFKAEKWIVDYLNKTNKENSDPMVFYCDMLKKYNHSMYVSGTNLPYGHSKYVHLSYQTINTLGFNDEQFQKCLSKHLSFIQKPTEYLNSVDLKGTSDSGDIDSVDIGDDKEKIEYHIPNWRRALNINSKLSEDPYIKRELRNTQKGLLTKLATGKILVEGQTRYLCRDLLPLLVSLIKNPPNWFTRYLYYRFYLPTDGKDTNALELGLDFDSYYAFFRNPHLSRNEQYIMQRFCDTDEKKYKGIREYKNYCYYKEIYDKYFGSLTGIVMVPRHTTMPLCLGGADFDGDLVSVVYNQDVVAAVANSVFERTATKYFGEVYQRKLPVIIIPMTHSEKTSIKAHVPYEHIRNTFSNRIGQISDAAISIGQKEYGHALTYAPSLDVKEMKNVEQIGETQKQPSCEMCTILTGLEIDAAKHGEHPNLDVILKSNIEKCSYISFLRKLMKLRSEQNYSFDNLKVELKKQDGKNDIEVSGKGCKTVAKFSIPSFGTYINELPGAFYKAFNEYVNDNTKNKEVHEEPFFHYDEMKKDDEETIDKFKTDCQNVFDYYFFYSKTLLHILSNEKNKGFYAIENLEKKLYQSYDEEGAERIQRLVVPRLLSHLKRYINEDNSVSVIKNRVNQMKWLLVPFEKREAVLEKIIGNGFSACILNDEEKNVLLNFYNRGYVNLWLILSIIEGPKTSSFDDVLSRNITSNIKTKNDNLDEKFTDYLRAYYDNNSSDAVSKIYTTCLEQLRKIINESSLSKQNKMAALYELTASSIDNRKLFWDVLNFETIKLYISEGELW